MKGFLFETNGYRRMIFTPSLVKHWQSRGAKLLGVWRFKDIAPYYNGRAERKNER